MPLLKQAVEQHTAGSPVNPGQLWMNRSSAKLSEELHQQGRPVDRKTVRKIFKGDLGLSRRQMVKTQSMGESANRDAQFQRMKKIKTEFFRQGFPV